MEKRYITIPGSIVCTSIDGRPVTDPDGAPVVVEFVTFIKGRLCDAIFSASMRAVIAQQEILAIFRGAPEGKVVAIDLDDYEFLLRSTETPSTPYEPLLAGCLLPHMLAIRDAAKIPTKTDPV